MNDQMDADFDRAEVTLRLLAWVIMWMGDRKKIGLGGYEQTDFFPVLKSFSVRKRSGYVLFWEKVLYCIKSYLFSLGAWACTGVGSIIL